MNKRTIHQGSNELSEISDSDDDVLNVIDSISQEIKSNEKVHVNTQIYEINCTLSDKDPLLMKLVKWVDEEDESTYILDDEVCDEVF